jgi:membrane protease YdiL (CAAX protease family)
MSEEGEPERRWDGVPVDPGPPTGSRVPGIAPPPGYRTEPADGVRYHRQVTRPRPWGRCVGAILLGGLGLVVGQVVVILAAVLGAKAIGHPITIDLNDGVNAGEMLALNLGLALLIPTSALTYWALYRRSPQWLGSLRPGLRGRWLLACAGMAAAVWVLLMAIATAGAAAERDSPIDSAVVWFLVVVLLTTPLQAAGEEFLFRGLILQGLGSTRLPTWACCVVSAALFATAHGQFDPPLFADRFVIGVVFAFLVVKTGGLEASIAVHAVKNLAGLIPAALVDDVSATLDPEGGVTWLPVTVDVVLLAILVPWVLAMCRRRVEAGELRTTYVADVTGPQPPSPIV